MTIRRIDGLSKKQAALELGLTPTRVDQLMKEGRLEYWETPLGRLIDRTAVDVLRRERELAVRYKKGTQGDLEAA